ncbi:pilus assembly PilX family protein [Legionella tucsonensis]|uniref:Tfp pilus assembly protein PilX n=1 Tax=Legionella tucsonensis TaxID=40335 RepID=A0A0W0ZYX1_9GAMM|nr:pilus assembly protein [Legionella tucsonensis]KTD74299.1 Tfp pilus assembly protein PilX [Legionella tucsonensis]
MNSISQNTKSDRLFHSNKSISNFVAEREVQEERKCQTAGIYMPMYKNSQEKVISVQQKGYVLIMTMILLLTLIALALTTVSLNTTQTRIAANATDTEISLEKTEGALNEAINILIKGTYNTTNFLQNSNGLYMLNPTDPPLWSTANWSSSSSVIRSFQGYSNTQASYIIEQLPSIVQPGQNMKTPTRIYRITARSIGANGNTIVMLQSTIQIQQ